VLGGRGPGEARPACGGGVEDPNGGAAAVTVLLTGWKVAGSVQNQVFALTTV